MAERSRSPTFLINDLGLLYSNPEWFVEAHPAAVRFHKLEKSTNDLGLLYLLLVKSPYKTCNLISKDG